MERRLSNAVLCVVARAVQPHFVLDCRHASHGTQDGPAAGSDDHRDSWFANQIAFFDLTNLLCLCIVTTFLKHDAIDYYPTDGAFIHGLYIEGARWPTGDEAGEPEMLTGTPVAGTLGDEILLNKIFSIIIVNFQM